MNDLPNLGPTSSRWLQSAGIQSIDHLRELGAVLAYRIVKQVQPNASLNLLWALAAGLEGRDWRDLSHSEKQSLKQQLDELDGHG